MTEPAPPGLFGWEPVTSVAGPGWAEATEETRAAAQRWAVGILWALSGRRFGLFAHRIAPYVAPRRLNAYDQRNRYGPLAVNYRAGVARAGGFCSANAVRLGPVHAVTGVQVDGVPLPAEAWRLDPDGTLVRTDGAGWPVGQDVYAASPRWLVDAVLGVAPPAAGNVAAGRYAGEWVRAAGGGRCSLPAGARSIARPGLTIELPDAALLTENGRTGSPEVDRWLDTVNPAGLPEAATVYSPDLARHRLLT